MLLSRDNGKLLSTHQAKQENQNNTGGFMSASVHIATTKVNDDILIQDLFTRFFKDKTLQQKIDKLFGSPDEKDTTGWENWLKFEFKFFIDFSKNNQTVVDLEPQLFKEGRQRADVLLNNTLLVEIKRKIQMSTCFRGMNNDFEKCKTGKVVENYKKIYFVGVYREANGDIETFVKKYFKGDKRISALMQKPILVGSNGYQFVILKYRL